LFALTWPLGIIQLLRHNHLKINYTGPKTVGTPHPSNHLETELPRMGEHGVIHSPKHPAPDKTVIGVYESQKIILFFALIQLVAFLLLLLINSILLQL